MLGPIKPACEACKRIQINKSEAFLQLKVLDKAVICGFLRELTLELQMVLSQEKTTKTSYRENKSDAIAAFSVFKQN